MVILTRAMAMIKRYRRAIGVRIYRSNGKHGRLYGDPTIIHMDLIVELL